MKTPTALFCLLAAFSTLARAEMATELPAIEVKPKPSDEVVKVSFKFRNKVGVDIAIEALRDAWTQRKATMDELWEAAEWCRMTHVMRPYLESVV